VSSTLENGLGQRFKAFVSDETCKIGIGNQASEQIDQKVQATAMTRMLNLTNVFELVIDTKSAPITHLLPWRLEVAAIQTKSTYVDFKKKGGFKQDLVSVL
jgi:hypothetical protein